MKLHQRTTIIVVIVFAVLAAFVYVVEMGTDQEAPSEEESTSVFSFSTSEVTLLKVTRPATAESVTVSREDDGAWRMTEPFGAEGDDTRVEGLLDSLGSLLSTRIIEGQDVDPEAFGLAEPALRVEVGLEEGEDQVLLVGNENPAGYSRYVQREGEERVYLVSSYTIDDLDELVSNPPEKPTPTPMSTETPLTTVITQTQTPPVSGTSTVAPTASAAD